MIESGVKKIFFILYSYVNRIKIRPVTVNVILLVYGAFCAYFLMKSLFTVDEINLNGQGRVSMLEMYVRALNGGESVPFLVTHQPSYYYYLATIGKIFGITNPRHLMIGAQLAVMGVLMTVYPYFIYRLTKSIIIALLTPFLINHLLGYFLYGFMYNIYWALIWPVVMGIPMVAILFKEGWNEKSRYMFIATCLVIAIGNVPRTQSSLPITLLLLIFLFAKVFIKPKKEDGVKMFFKKNTLFFIALAILLVSQNILSTIIPRLIYPTDYHVLRPWHALYIGLGWEENKYGIIYADYYARDLVLSINPNVILYADEYDDIIKQEYFTILKEDPKFFFGSYFRKFIAITRRSCNHFIGCFGNSGIVAAALSLFAVFCALYNENKNRFGVYISICALIALFPAMSTVIIATPGNLYYTFGPLAAARMLGFSVYVIIIQFIISVFDERIISSGKLLPETPEISGGQ